MITGVLLAGKKYSGKDTMYEHIAKMVMNREVVKVKWATSLREDVIDMLEAIGEVVTMDDLEDRQKKELYVPLLQWYGTDYRRKQDYDYWVKRGMQEIREMRVGSPYENALFVNTDTRFLNEVLIPEQYGFISIRLEVSPENQRLRAEKLGETLTEAKRLHSSETALDEAVFSTYFVKDGMGIVANGPTFDAVIDANAPIEEVEMQVSRVLLDHGVDLRCVVC